VRATPPHQSSPSSSPVLSIHDLERRFRNRLSPIQDRYNQQCRRKPPSVTLARLLHAVADLLGSCDANDALNTRHSFALN
jgi:regulator of sirC expression with transglutaminase-like and TPR domain